MSSAFQFQRPVLFSAAILIGGLLAGLPASGAATPPPDETVLKNLQILQDPNATEDEQKKASHAVWYAMPGRLGDVDRELIVSVLDKSAKESQIAYVRYYAVMGLATIVQPSALDPLIAALGQAEARTRTEACRGLGKLGAKAEKAIPALIKGIDADELSGDAMNALMKIQGKEAVEPVLRAIARGKLNSNDRFWASVVLTEYPDVRARAFMERELTAGTVDTRLRATMYFAKLDDGDTSLKHMREILANEVQDRGDGQMRATAIEYLAAKKDAASYAAILQMATADSEIQARQAATVALGRYADPKAIPALAQIFKQPDTGFESQGHANGSRHAAAVRSLAQIGTDEAFALIYDGLASEGTLQRACMDFWSRDTSPDLPGRFAALLRKRPISGTLTFQIIQDMLNKRSADFLEGEEAVRARGDFREFVRDDAHFGRNVDLTQGGQLTADILYQFHKSGFTLVTVSTRPANPRPMGGGYFETSIVYWKVDNAWLPICERQFGGGG
jgi:HEAT repeat protein